MLASATQVARAADFAVHIFAIALVATAPDSIAASKLRRSFSCRSIFLYRCAPPRENALRSARADLIAPSRGRKDADYKNGGPRSRSMVRTAALAGTFSVYRRAF